MVHRKVFIGELNIMKTLDDYRQSSDNLDERLTEFKKQHYLCELAIDTFKRCDDSYSKADLERYTYDVLERDCSQFVADIFSNATCYGLGDKTVTELSELIDEYYCYIHEQVINKIKYDKGLCGGLNE